MSRTTKMLALAAISACSVACGGKAELRAKAMADLAPCPEASIETSGSTWTNLGEAKGCGKENRYVYTDAGWVSALDRAHFELSCKKEELTVHVMNYNMVGVSGCGKKAVYLLRNGNWLMNSAAESQNKPSQ